jgi:hypothetical protein
MRDQAASFTAATLIRPRCRDANGSLGGNTDALRAARSRYFVIMIFRGVVGAGAAAGEIADVAHAFQPEEQSFT